MIASFILRFHSCRYRNLAQTLRFMKLWHSTIAGQCELITVCHDSFCEKLDTDFWQIHRHYDLRLDEMQPSYMTNFGVSQCQSEKIILLDDDRILPAGYFSDIILQLQEGLQITTCNSMKLDREYDDQEIINNRYGFTVDRKTQKHEQGRRCMWSGNVAFMKQDFIKVGQMDEGYVGYGWDDTDMLLTTESHGIQSVYREDPEIHLWHLPATYGIKDQKQLFINNGKRFCKKWNKPFPQFLRDEIEKYKPIGML